MDASIALASHFPNPTSRHMSLYNHYSVSISFVYVPSAFDVTGSALWRMRATLREHDRVREVSFEGKNGSFEIFIKATGSTRLSFPLLSGPLSQRESFSSCSCFTVLEVLESRSGTYHFRNIESIIGRIALRIDVFSPIRPAILKERTPTITIYLIPMKS